MKSRKKQFLVLGLGRFGASLARHLCQLGHEVLAVDMREDHVEAIAPYVTQAIQADATNEEALESMGVRNFDAAIVTIGQNIRDSILVSVLCKEKGVPMVMAKAVDDLHAKVLEKVGVDRVVFPEQDMGQRVARSLVTPGILDLMEISEEYQIAETSVPSAWLNKTLMEINVRRNYGLSVIGIRRGTRFLASPGADTRLEAEDVLIVLGKHQDVIAIEGR